MVREDFQWSDRAITDFIKNIAICVCFFFFMSWDWNNMLSKR